MGEKGGMFRYADGIDKLLMLFGTLGSIGDGLMSPLTMIVLSGVINDYGTSDVSFSNDVVDKVYMKLQTIADSYPYKMHTFGGKLRLFYVI